MTLTDAYNVKKKKQIVIDVTLSDRTNLFNSGKFSSLARYF